ncbi:hypothetical protein Daus18300_004200 [Diaporthe australafricana]|uniref:NACHT domain-containing protein n=1 Tax=Diaporthe australafricana TaxID=127596 RepID=A0ABR3XAK1_9PEZI
MDPATIIGTTSAILSFVLFVGNVISVANKIHDSADGATDDNRSLEEAVTDFQNNLENLRHTGKFSCSTDSQTGAYAAKTDAESNSLLRTAHECEILGNKTLEVLNKTKAKANHVDEKHPASRFKRAWKRSRKDSSDRSTSSPKQPSLVEGIRAGIQTVWQKDKVDALRRQWEGCVFRFNMDLARLDTGEKHDIICAAFKKNSEQVEKIRELVDSLVQQSRVSKLECLQSFLDDFKDADTLPRLEQRNHEWILKALEFEGMNARRAQVEWTEGDTFEWLITDDAVPDNHPDLKVSFKQWLSTGRGVYHVTGKPGSGKSTLMKLIDHAAATREQLESWASQTQERLIMATFYTWKAASAHPLQNQEVGLARTLLHQILTAAPQLTKVVFAKHSCWNPQEFRFINFLSRSQWASAKSDFESEEIFAALESSLRAQGYRFFLLVDGMDEFENPNSHSAIAKRVLKWSSHNSERLKICVSSREDNTFMDKFSADQRLRLHIVTEKDVRELVATRLMEHDHFVVASENDRENLTRKIVGEAKGVFLWVVFTIQELKPLLDDRQSFQTLVQAVEELPKEMEEFLHEILERVPARYKKESAAIFSATTSTLGQDRSLSLFHYSMLRECLDFEEPDVDEKTRHMSLNEIVTQLKDFRSRLPNLCKGLLETTPDFRHSILLENMDDGDYRDTLRCTHRSVFDFLRNSTEELSAAIDSSLPFEALGEALALRSVIKVAKAIPWDESMPEDYQSYLQNMLRMALSAGAEPRIRFKWWYQEDSPDPQDAPCNSGEDASHDSIREADLYHRDMPFA